MSDLRLPPLQAAVEPLSVVRQRARVRIRQLWLALSLCLFVVGARGVMLGIWPGHRTVRALVASRFERVAVAAVRGDILDRNGEKLATTVLTPNVIVSPKDILLLEQKNRPVDVPANARRLAEVLGADPAELERRMRGPAESQNEVVAIGVDGATALAVDRLRLPGVQLKWTPRRFYPDRELAASVLGFLDQADDPKGAEGVEALFEDELHGEEISVLRLRKFGEAAGAEGARGSDVWLTLDRAIQRSAEGALDDVVAEFSPRSASAVVVEVASGEILAMATRPTFNPNPSVLGRSPARDRRNWAAEANYEPGSVIKPFVIAAALDQRRIQASDRIDCTGVPGYPAIGETHERFTTLSVTEVLARSSNVGSARIAVQLGAPDFRAAMQAFGLAESPGLGLRGEADGELDPTTLVQTLPYHGFGQGMAASPVQMASALAALGNDGVRMRPILVSRVVDPRGVPDFLRRPKALGAAVSPEAARQVRQMMEAVMGPDGTGRSLHLDRYSVAGKTGTSQVWEGGQYSDAVVASFMALVPASEPVLAIVVMVDRPNADFAMWGANVAGPAVLAIADDALSYLGVPPDLAEAAARGPTPADPGPISVVWRGEGWSVPDLRGRSVRAALAALAPSGLMVSVSGSGLVTAQQPLPGAVVRPGDRLSLVLQ